MTLAALLRSETTPTLKQIAERLQLGKPKGAKANLHRWMSGRQENPAQPTLGI